MPTIATGFAVTGVASDLGEPWLDLGAVAMRSGKVVRAWAIRGDLDPALARSNEIEIEWPPRSGRRILIPEVDRVAWFGLEEARIRLNPGQAPFLDRLEAAGFGGFGRATPGTREVPGDA